MDSNTCSTSSTIKTMPVLFLAHGSPMLHKASGALPPQMARIHGPSGLLATFLSTLGPRIKALSPQAIVVFSAHYETNNTVHITSTHRNTLLYDYNGFPKEMYALDDAFVSSGDPAVAQMVADAVSKAGMNVHLDTKRGLDHGVFIPFMTMFGAHPPTPIVEVSMPSLDTDTLVRLGNAVATLRDNRILVIAGGLTVHTFEDFRAWDPDTADHAYLDLHRCIVALGNEPASTRLLALNRIMAHPQFRKAHPTPEHFMPLAIACGAASRPTDNAYVVSDIYGAVSIAFGDTPI